MPKHAKHGKDRRRSTGALLSGYICTEAVCFDFGQFRFVDGALFFTGFLAHRVLVCDEVSLMLCGWRRGCVRMLYSCRHWT